MITRDRFLFNPCHSHILSVALALTKHIFDLENGGFMKDREKPPCKRTEVKTSILAGPCLNSIVRGLER